MNIVRFMVIAGIALGLMVNTSAGIVLPADLELTKEVNKTEAFEGDTVFFTIGVTNYGPGAADVIVEDPLPVGLSFQTSSVSHGEYIWATGLWSVGTLPNGHGAILNLWALVEPGTLGQRLYNTATASGLVHDEIPQNDSITVYVDIIPEPATVGLLLVVVGGLTILKGRRSIIRKRRRRMSYIQMFSV